MKPLLLLDVDGVLNPFPDTPEGFEEYDFFPEDNEPVRLSHVHGGWLHELAQIYEIVWATGWGPDANRVLSPFFDLPPLRAVAFPAIPFEPRAKVPAVEAFVDDEPVAWVDDLTAPTPEAQAWAERRKAPTLLMEVDSSTGWARGDVERLLEWAAGLPDDARR